MSSTFSVPGCVIEVSWLGNLQEHFEFSLVSLLWPDIHIQVHTQILLLGWLEVR